ncbi:MAG TPA: sugar ABC transporter ATP-binding protein [Pirellulales bacterium]|jgi:ribose transport system ATP-binding protein
MPTHSPDTEALPTGFSAAPLLTARHISKTFPGIKALDDVQLELRAGEVLCIVGENGAGKSTLMKILGGIYTPDAGEIQIDGHTVRLGSVQEAQAAGVMLIHQELNLAESLDVAGNIFLGREPRYAGPLRLLDRRIYADAEKITRRVGLAANPHELVSRLSIGQQQLVEIARSLSMSSRVLIMDEPTSSLSAQDTERLFAVIDDLRRSGVGILYISHRLPEVQEIADRVTVLRDGRNAGELARGDINHASLVRLMIGRELKQFFVRSHRPVVGAHAPVDASDNVEADTAKPSPGLSQRERNKTEKAERAIASALAVNGFQVTASQRRPIEFQIAPGEIVGLAGLVGAGRTELAEALFGIRRPIAGSIVIAGQKVDVRDPNDAIKAGLFLVPEDRRTQGLLLDYSVRRNISLASLEFLSRLGIIRRGEERSLANRMCERLSVRTSSIDKPVGMLSGGNQQKVVLAKWLARQPKLLILDEPTRGVDVGAKREIYALMDELTGTGVGILMISSDLEEILGMSDRVLVMHDGELAGALARHQLSEQAVMTLATGGEQGV